MVLMDLSSRHGPKSGAGEAMATINGNNADNVLEGGLFADTISGLGGNDRLSGKASDDTLFGGNGNDLLEGGSGEDAMFGGNGIDTVRYSGGGEITVSLDFGGRFAEAEDDTYSGIENVDLSAKTDRATVFGDAVANVIGGTSFADGLLGGGGDDVLLGAGGDDQIQGGNGDDLIFGGIGADQIDGRDGSDTASYVNSAAKVVVDLRLVSVAQTGASASSESTGDILREIENVVGSDFDDTLTGDNGANRLAGGKGFNTLTGLLGDDSYSHVADGWARDTVVDSGGNDVLALPLSDVVSIFRQSATNGSLSPDDLVVQIRTKAVGGFTGVVIVDHFAPGHAVETLFDTNTGQTFILAEGLIGGNGNGIIGGTVGGDVMDGRGGNDLLFGVAGDDIASGGERDDSVNGGLGHDSLFGGNGDDTLSGEGGNDRLFGEAGDDVLGGGNGNDSAEGGSGNDTVTGYGGGDRLDGDTGDDRLYGGGGNDRLFGGNGSDRLVGSDGADVLWGGGDGDVFLLNAIDHAINEIRDFGSGDRIVFDADLFAPVQLRRQIADIDGDGRADTRLSIVDATGATLTAVVVSGATVLGDVIFQ